jgi:terminase small subunit-like protein
MTQDTAQVIDLEGDEVEAVEEQDIPEQAEQVLRLISNGMSVFKACGEVHIATNTWYDWLRAMPALELRYAHACADRAAKLAEEAHDIADQAVNAKDNTAVQAAKLRVDTRRWFAAKLDPKRYGDYQRTEMTVTESGNVAGAAQSLLQLRKKRQKAK